MKNNQSPIFVRANLLKYSVMILLLQGMLRTTAQTYSIINATSTPGVNGVYSEDGSHHEKAKYTNGQYTLFYAQDQHMKWAIVANNVNLNASDASNSPYRYSTIIDEGYPPARGWHHGGNTTGLPGEYIIVAPINSIGYDKYFFVESLADDGTIKDTAKVYLYADEITFTGNNDDDFVTAGKASFSNLPAGLTAKLIRTSDTTLLAFLEGNAENHTFNDDVDSLILTFDNTAVSNNDISLIDKSTVGFKIMYQNPFAVSGTDTYPLASGIYMLEGLFNEKPYFRYNDFYLMIKACIPRWIIRTKSVVHPIYSTQYDSYLPSNRQWHNEGYYYTIKDSITVGMVNSIIYKSYSHVESESDNGSFNDSIEISYYYPENGESFSGVPGDDFVASGKVTVSNLPVGLSAEVIKFNDTTLYAKLTGQEINHDVSDNINDVMIGFTEDAFTGQGIFKNNSKNIDSVSIVHMEQYMLVDTTSFYKASNGLYSPFEIINNHTAFWNYSDYYFVYRNSPPNCVWSVIKKGKMGSAVYSSGIDTNYPPPDGWLVGDWNSSTTAYIEIFPVQPWLSYSSLEFTESTTERGIIDDTVSVMLNHREGIIFTGDAGDDYISEGKAVLNNVPEGLEPVMIKENDTLVYLLFSGTATNHTTAYNTANVIIRFADNAFTGTAENVKYSKKYNIKILFNNITDLVNDPADTKGNLILSNPASDNIFVNIQAMHNEEFNYKLYNIIGEVVTTGKQSGNKIDIAAIPKGMYVLMVDTNNNILLEKLIIE